MELVLEADPRGAHVFDCQVHIVERFELCFVGYHTVAGEPGILQFSKAPARSFEKLVRADRRTNGNEHGHENAGYCCMDP